MQTIVGNFEDLARWRTGDPQFDAENREPVNGYMELRLSHPATTPDNSPAPELIEVPLNADGTIPPDTMIWANDELQPRGTYYQVGVYAVRAGGGWVFHENLAISGEGPIDLRSLSPLGKYPAEPESPAEPVAPPLPAKRVRGARYTPFVPVEGSGPFGSNRIGSGKRDFYLAHKAVVREASIVVDTPHKNRAVTVALHSHDDQKDVCAVSIDAAERGFRRAFFEQSVVLNPGEYSLKWTVDDPGSLLEVRTFGDGLPVVTFST